MDDDLSIVTEVVVVGSLSSCHNRCLFIGKILGWNEIEDQRPSAGQRPPDYECDFLNYTLRYQALVYNINMCRNRAHSELPEASEFYSDIVSDQWLKCLQSEKDQQLLKRELVERKRK